MSFYENFEEICKKIGKTPFRVTQEIGLSNSIIYYWRHGKRYPNHETIKKIAEYLKVEPEELNAKYVINDIELTKEQYQKVMDYINELTKKK